MYIEFIIGYILTAILAVLLIVVIVLQCIILKKFSHMGFGRMDNSVSPYLNNNVCLDKHMTVVCRKCATPYDAVNTKCPKCGTPR